MKSFVLFFVLTFSLSTYSKNIAQAALNALEKKSSKEEIFKGLKEIIPKGRALSKHLTEQNQYHPELYGYLADLNQVLRLLPKSSEEVKSCSVMDKAYNAYFGLEVGDKRPQALVDFWKIFKKVCSP